MNKKEKRKSVVSSVGQPGPGQEAHKGRNGGGQRGGGGRGRGRDSGADSGSNKVTPHRQAQLLIAHQNPALFIAIITCFRARCLARTRASLRVAAHREAEAAEAGGERSHQQAGGRGAPGGSHPSLR